MKKGTLKTIIILVALLFLNIEAAQAGLIQRFKLYIRHEFTDFQLIYLCFGTLSVAFLLYIIVTPVYIGKEKRSWLNYYNYNPGLNSYQSKRMLVRKISGILNNTAENH